MGRLGVVTELLIVDDGSTDGTADTAAELAGKEAAEVIQLELEYVPDPPFTAGTPDTAPFAVLEAARAQGAGIRVEREALVAAVTGVSAVIVGQGA